MGGPPFPNPAPDRFALSGSTEADPVKGQKIKVRVRKLVLFLLFDIQKSTIEVGKEAIQKLGFAHYAASGPASAFLAALAIRERSSMVVVSERERLLTKIVLWTSVWGSGQ